MIALLALLAYVACVPAANFLIGHVGTVCLPHGPCLIPVGFGLTAPSGVLVIGLALVLRDFVQEQLGARVAVSAVIAGALLSALVAPAALAVASAMAFIISEGIDTAVFTPLRRRGFMLAMIASSIIGLCVDSAVFLTLAFGSLHFLAGQVVGKLWMVLAAAPVTWALRRRGRP